MHKLTSKHKQDDDHTCHFLLRTGCYCWICSCCSVCAQAQVKELRQVKCKSALEIRGGAGPIEAETAAKVVGGLALTTGSVFTVADKFCNKSYGLEGDVSPTDAQLTIKHNLQLIHSWRWFDYVLPFVPK